MLETRNEKQEKKREINHGNTWSVTETRDKLAVIACLPAGICTYWHGRKETTDEGKRINNN